MMSKREKNKASNRLSEMSRDTNGFVWLLGSCDYDGVDMTRYFNPSGAEKDCVGIAGREDNGRV